ncbi:branched-chain-amino-acid aminotransferase [Clostridium homopropionicum DSM 5847]|uniref:Branched-chain-amino-acid aminotransferase n=1 Tax=Clostridium homopropionicum DSM 5847 TaxID=1121318 RepID=A0A0L6Z684_9CLOT|nr:aminotransferase class IV [Clostridium homopropionicum]KOA18482.1 branched-chain-amino-acid aminotransferase [Clostridium homopropionicum DSM 5847]SFF66068.1 4-amino-4-deoxychorismate lyase [Clostridium homopropionicum]
MILLNGKIIENKNILLDSGFYFGRGLFETMLVNNVPLFLEEHLDRINNGLSTIEINKEITKDEVMAAVKKLQCSNCVLKLVVTENNTLFTIRRNNYTQEHYKKGFKVKISSVKRNEFSKLTYLKSLNYLENILEHEKCINEGYNEVLFFNTEGKLSEGSLSNVFFIKNKKIYTPSVECGLLEGTVRKFIINNFDVTEGKFSKENLLSADSVFLTNSIMGIMKVFNIYEKSFDEDSIIEQIKKVYEDQVSKQKTG